MFANVLRRCASVMLLGWIGLACVLLVPAGVRSLPAAMARGGLWPMLPFALLAGVAIGACLLVRVRSRVARALSDGGVSALLAFVAAMSLGQVAQQVSTWALAQPGLDWLYLVGQRIWNVCSGGARLLLVVGLLGVVVHRPGARPLLVFVAVWAACLLSGVGVLVVLAVGTIPVAILLGAVAAADRFLTPARAAAVRRIFFPLAAMAASTTLGLTLVESISNVAEKALGQGNNLVLPAAWRLRRVPGGYYWHGHLHEFNRYGFRGPDWSLEASPDSARVVALGDSFTYGQAVEAWEAWPEVLERGLVAERYDVEVMNLGHLGDNSEDVLRNANNFLPRLKPELVLYAVCVNDFLNSNEGLNRHPKGFPERLFLETRAGQILGAAYGQILVLLGIQPTFTEDILKDFGNYRERFAGDVSAINKVAIEVSGQPLMAMVVTQHFDPELERVTGIAEGLLEAGGAVVIPVSGYIHQMIQLGAGVSASRWDDHPSAEAHKLFAEAFAKEILRHSLPPRTLRAESTGSLGQYDVQSGLRIQYDER